MRFTVDLFELLRYILFVFVLKYLFDHQVVIAYSQMALSFVAFVEGSDRLLVQGLGSQDTGEHDLVYITLVQISLTHFDRITIHTELFFCKFIIIKLKIEVSGRNEFLKFINIK